MAKRVLMVGPSIDAMGGVATVERNILKAVSMTGRDVTFVATTDDCSKLGKVLLFLRAMRKIKHQLKTCDVCHVHMALGMSFQRKYLVCREAARADVPYILHVHEGDFENLYEAMTSSQQTRVGWMFQNAEIIIALSNEWRDYLKEKFCLDNIAVLENAVFIPKDVAKSKSADKFYFLGSMCARKGVDTLLYAVHELTARHPEIKLFLAGGGEKLHIYEMMARDLNIEDNVEFLGWADEPMKEKLADVCLVSVLPSNAEGLPMSVLEAMAAGCVAIATEVGGLPSLIKNGENGFLIKPKDFKELAKAMAFCIENPDTTWKIAENGRQTIIKRYSMDKYICDLEKIYESCCR